MALYIPSNKHVRETLLAVLFFLPEERKLRINRWLRGRHEHHKLRHADVVIVSFGKSGRTWLRTMLTRFYQRKHKIDRMELIGFYNFHKYNAEIPRVFFTHDSYIKDYVADGQGRSAFRDKKVLLLVRDPRDVAVSSYFQRKFRPSPGKKGLRDIEVEEGGPSMHQFVLFRVPLIADFMNGWRDELGRVKDSLVVRYEDLRSDPEARLAEILDFLGSPGTSEEVADAVSFAAYENMKKLEASRAFGAGDRRISPGDQKNPDSYKVRRAKVGGYRDYFSDQEVREIDDLVEERLSADFGYGRAEGAAPPEAAARAQSG